MQNNRPLIFFYVLVVYVLLQFVWWAYMLFNLNNEIHLLKLELIANSFSSIEQIEEQQAELDKKLYARWVMIIGEGAVFLSLLAFGIYRVRKTFRQEIALSRQQQNFLLSVTHELKTPLASNKLFLQTLEKHELSKEKQAEIIKKAISDVDRLNSLVDNILLSARIENGEMLLQKENYSLSQLTQSVIENSGQLAFYKNRISVQTIKDTNLNLDKNAFSSILLNLIENALKYSPAESKVTIEIDQTENKAILRVKDEGIGMSEYDKKHAFDKFYRSGNEETRNTKGTGLGLFIVKNLVQWHKGAIRILNNQPKGTIFEIQFPIN
ncbi:MAG: sensor histidine kinase [Bacteroidia bacterium]